MTDKERFLECKDWKDYVAIQKEIHIDINDKEILDHVRKLTKVVNGPPKIEGLIEEVPGVFSRP